MRVSTAWRWIAGLALAAALIVLSNGPVFLISRRVLDAPGTWEERFVRPAFIAAALTMTALFIAATIRRETRRVSPMAFPLAGFVVVAIASVTWSVAPSLTGWRSWIYAAMALGGWTLATMPLRAVHRIVATFSAVCTLLSLVLIALRPDIGIDDFGAWRGTYLSPNSLAPIAGILAIVAVGDLVRLRFGRDAQDGEGGRAVPGLRVGLDLAAIATAVAIIVSARSVTPGLAAVLSVGFASGVWLFRWLQLAGRRRAALAFLAGTGAFGALAALAVGPRLWSTAHFELRRELWGHIIDRVAVHPVRGYGHFAYWDVPALLEPRLLVRTGSSHNSFLEVLLGLGVIGLVCFAPIMIASIVQPLRQLWHRQSADAFVWMSLSLFVFIENLTESFILWFSYMWVLIIASALRPVRTSFDSSTIQTTR